MRPRDAVRFSPITAANGLNFSFRMCPGINPKTRGHKALNVKFAAFSTVVEKAALLHIM